MAFLRSTHWTLQKLRFRYYSQVVSSTHTDKASLKYRTSQLTISNWPAILLTVVSTLSTLRHPAYTTISDLAAANDGLAILNLSKLNVEKWSSEWDNSEGQSQEDGACLRSDGAMVSSFLLVTPTASNHLFRKNAFGYALTYVRLLPVSCPEAQSAVISVIADALHLLTAFDFDPLFK